jgi:hypothetical protein
MTIIGPLLLAFWYFILFIAVVGIILLCLTVIAGVVLTIGVGVASFWASLRDSKPQVRIPRWAEWLDDFH